MRILRLDLGSVGGTIDFHPFISIAHGLDHQQRSAIVTAFRDLVRGTTTDLSGLVERDGELLELGATPAPSLGPFTTEDIVVSVDTQVIDSSEVDEALLRIELDQALLQAECDAVHVEEIRADLDSTALAVVQRLRRALAGTSPLTAAELDRQSKVSDVESAIKSTHTIEPVLYESRSEVAGLVERWTQYQEAETAAASHLSRLEQKVGDAEAGVSRARESLAEAQRCAVPLMLSPADDDRLCELAEISFDRRGRRAKRRSAEQEAEYEELLAKVNQPTHAAYAMYRLAPHADPEGIAAVNRATKSVERAQHNLDLVRASFDADPVVVELVGELELVKVEARLHLGPMLPSDLGTALLALRHETMNPQWTEALCDVRLALQTAGAELTEDIAGDEVVDWATAWIDNNEREVAEQRVAIDRVEVGNELQLAERALHRHTIAMTRISQVEDNSEESASNVESLRLALADLDGTSALSSLDLVSRIEPLAEIIRTEAGDSVPLVLIGDFELVPDEEVAVLLDRLEMLAENIQLVVLTERAQALEWADGAGLRRALRSTMLGLRM